MRASATDSQRTRPHGGLLQFRIRRCLWPGSCDLLGSDKEAQGPAHFHHRLWTEASLQVAVQFDFGDVPKIHRGFTRRVR